MRPEVRHTLEFDRVAGLTRRRIAQADADAWATVLTAELRCTGAPASARLRPWQAYCLAEAAENAGGWFALPVGLGKTLIAELLPRVMGCKRPMLIIPASLKDKTYADRQSFLGTWRLSDPPPRITTLQELAPEGGATLIQRFQPDLIVIDEADDLANRDSSAARRIDRYVVDTQEGVSVVAMTGTPSRKSIMGYWHLLCWALRERAPMPLNEGEALMWAAALDEKGRAGVRRPGPGPLGPTITHARAWFQSRLAETPGVVIVDGDSAGAVPLTVRTRLAKEDAEIDKHYERFMLEHENPGGIPVSDPLSRWRIDGQLGCGLYLYWDPPAPEDWRTARRAVAKLVRDAIQASTHTRHPLDTEAQVLKRFENHPVVIAWREIKPTFEARTAAAWLSGATLESAVEWYRESAAPGIIWCGGVEFAGALATATRLSYFGREGKSERGVGLHVAPVDRSMIASWHANKKGFNLQAWRRHLIVDPPASAKWLEQIFGRSHRSGQTEPVTVDVLMTSGGTMDRFEAALAEAGFARSTVGLTQKILRATIIRAKPLITTSNRFRWATG